MIRVTSIFLFIILLLACSSSRQVFTRDLRISAVKDDSDLKRIQFYVSRDIVLTRRIDQSKSQISKGKIVVKDGSTYEEVIIRAQTPGLVLFTPDGERLAVSFDTDGAYLMFGPKSRTGEYVLLASKWEKNRGWISYDDKEYETSSESANAFLMADASFVRKVVSSQKIAKGRQLRN
jgi:hypothetical protein